MTRGTSPSTPSVGPGPSTPAATPPAGRAPSSYTRPGCRVLRLRRHRQRGQGDGGAGHPARRPPRQPGPGEPGSGAAGGRSPAPARGHRASPGPTSAMADRATRTVGLRFYRQIHRIDVAVGAGPLDPRAGRPLMDAFRQRYERIVGAGTARDDAPVEVVNSASMSWSRCHRRPSPSVRPGRPGPSGPAPRGSPAPGCPARCTSGAPWAPGQAVTARRSSSRRSPRRWSTRVRPPSSTSSPTSGSASRDRRSHIAPRPAGGRAGRVPGAPRDHPAPSQQHQRRCGVDPQTGVGLPDRRGSQRSEHRDHGGGRPGGGLRSLRPDPGGLHAPGGVVPLGALRRQSGDRTGGPVHHQRSLRGHTASARRRAGRARSSCDGTLVAWCASVVHQSDVGGPDAGRDHLRRPLHLRRGHPDGPRSRSSRAAACATTSSAST